MARYVIGVHSTVIKFVEVEARDPTSAERLVRAWIDLGKPAGVEQIKGSSLPNEVRADGIASVEEAREV